LESVGKGFLQEKVGKKHHILWVFGQKTGAFLGSKTFSCRLLRLCVENNE
jgi:hypothetical protein